MVFQETAAKFAIGFFSYIKIFENTAFGHATEVPTPTQGRSVLMKKNWGENGIKTFYSEMWRSTV